MINIFITGGTGLIGSTLIYKLLASKQYSITILTRNITKATRKFGNNVKYCTSLDSLKNLDDYIAVVNLAGEPMTRKHWSDKQKDKLNKSRWEITRKLAKLITSGKNPPNIFISGSAIGFYGAHKDDILTESSYPHDEFTFRLCSKWEALALSAASAKTRVCILRTGIVLSDKGGMLPLITVPFRIGFGNSIGNGKQYLSWIHITDMIDGIIFLLNLPEAKGVFNFTSPNPVTNKRFSRILARTLFRPCIFRIPNFLVKLALGEAATMITDGQRVMPQHLQDIHFQFSFERLDDALNDILLKKSAIPHNTNVLHHTE
ncbi:MAG: TIGR01777 family oxidoreductase [Dysgonomonas sp.]|nr:TIGR01777 family oxidoreductase [Dysgonomonas sp.]